MRRIGLIIATLVAGAIGIASSIPALAVDMPAPAARISPAPVIDTWTFSLTPYAWMTALNGSTTVKGRTIDVNASFIDILNHTQFPKGLFEVAAFGEARYGRFAILTDVVYMRLGLDPSITRSRGVDKLNASVGASAGMTIEMVIAELAAAYEIARWSSGPFPGQSALDLYAGGRAWWQRAEANLALLGTVNIGDLTLTGDRTLSAEGSVRWLDPVVGARWRHQFGPAWDLVVSGDVADLMSAASSPGRRSGRSATNSRAANRCAGAACSATRRCRSTIRADQV